MSFPVILRLVRFTREGGPIQINAICPRCFHQINTYNVSDLQYFKGHKCPEILSLEPLSADSSGTFLGQIDPEKLMKFLRGE